MTRSRGLCMAPSPALTVGDFYFRGGGCRKHRRHLGVHVNPDGTRWDRRMQARLYLTRLITGSAYP